MSRIRSRGNKDTEGALVVILRAAGVGGWRRHSEIKIGTSNIKRPTSNIERGKKAGCTGGPIVGETKAKVQKARQFRASHVSLRPFRVRPDFVWRRERVAVFVDGCFWHGCPWHGTKPSSNKSFWREKLGRNRTRDVLVSRTLRQAGWRVLRIWEHTLPRAARDAAVLERLLKKIRENIEHRTPNIEHRKVGKPGQ